MDINTEENRKILINLFPLLGNDQHYSLLSEATPVYNCIVWAMGYNDRWIDTYYSPGHWWPDGVSRDTKPQSLIGAFIAEGFEVTDNSHYEDGYDKVVLFQRNGMWTHASRIESDDTEYSKFGGLFDGVHSRNVFTNSLYGDEFAYLRRPIARRPDGTMVHGGISVHLENLIF